MKSICLLKVWKHPFSFQIPKGSLRTWKLTGFGRADIWLHHPLYKLFMKDWSYFVCETQPQLWELAGIWIGKGAQTIRPKWGQTAFKQGQVRLDSCFFRWTSPIMEFLKPKCVTCTRRTHNRHRELPRCMHNQRNSSQVGSSKCFFRGRTWMTDAATGFSTCDNWYLRKCMKYLKILWISMKAMK